jgi:short-subunit dehydrogenase
MGIYAASKHAIEGYSESLDHEVRQFGIRVSLIEPGFTRTKLDENARIASPPLQAYAEERARVREAVRTGITKGDDPIVVASMIVKALNSRRPRLRYTAGGEAKLLSILRKYAPSKSFDKSLRKQFRLDAA